MRPHKSAILMLGMQSDHYAANAPLRDMVESPQRIDAALEKAMDTAESLGHEALVIHVPIQFSPDYREITQEVGTLAAIKQLGLFQAGEPGACTIPDLDQLSCTVETIQGRTGFNAFRGTGLDTLLARHGIRTILMMGASMAACIDSTARTAYELGYEVIILEDCIVSRTSTEHDLYCTIILPQYATVTRADRYLGKA